MDLKKRYGRLTVTSQPERVKNNYRVRVRCDCGMETYQWVHNLKSGATTSCGCLRAELAAERFKKREADRAREMFERVEAEKRLEKLKRLISKTASRSKAIDEITNGVTDKIDEVAHEIRMAASQEHWRKCKPLKELLDTGHMPGDVYERDTKPFFDEYNRIGKEVDETRKHLNAMWSEISIRADRRGKRAMWRAKQASEALFTRVQAKSWLSALRKLGAECDGEIAQRLFAPVQAVQEAIQRWLAANRSEQGERPSQNPTGIVLQPASVPAVSPVAAV
jgi:hypothetical protein